MSMIRVECRAAIRTNYDVLKSWFKINKYYSPRIGNIASKLSLEDISNIENEDEKLTFLLEYYFQNSKNFKKTFQLNTSSIKKTFHFDEFGKATIFLMERQFNNGLKFPYESEIKSIGNKPSKIQDSNPKRIRGPTVKNPFTLSKINKDGKKYKELELDKYYIFESDDKPILKSNLPDKKYYKKRNLEYLQVKDKLENIFFVEIQNNNKKYFIEFEYKK